MARKAKEPKIPKRVQRVVERCQAGEVLCTQVSPRGGERRFWFEPSQKEVSALSCNEAIRAGLIVPSGDDLFGDNSQTYRAAP